MCSALRSEAGQRLRATLGQCKHTGSYSWPDQVDGRFCPSSAPHFHMNAEYAKGKKQQDPCPTEALQAGSAQICRQHPPALQRAATPPSQVLLDNKWKLRSRMRKPPPHSQGQCCCQPGSLWIKTTYIYIFRDGLSWMDTNTDARIETGPWRLRPSPPHMKGFSQTKGLSSKTNSRTHGNGNEGDAEAEKRKGVKMCRPAYLDVPVPSLLPGRPRFSQLRQGNAITCSYACFRPTSAS